MGSQPSQSNPNMWPAQDMITRGLTPPMPSLTSHPPLIQQRMPVPGPLLKDFHQNVYPAQLWVVLPSSPRQPSEAGAFSPPSTPPQEYPCPFCDQVYKKVGHLNRHTLTHAGRRFGCEAPGCDKTFTRLDNMRTQ
jgi:hypothetical protein